MVGLEASFGLMTWSRVQVEATSPENPKISFELLEVKKKKNKQKNKNKMVEQVESYTNISP